MKLLLIVLILFIQTPSIEDHVLEIRKHFNYVEDNLPSFKIEKDESYDQSTGGSTISKYYDNGNLVKIRVEHLGETGKLYQEYFIKNQSLLFVYEQKFEYNMPYYVTKKMAEEMGFEEGYDPKKTNKSDSRYYFQNGTLIRWINPKGEVIRSKNLDWEKQQDLIIDDFKNLIEK